MLDSYTPPYVMITPEIGEILKQFRLSKNVSSKAIADALHKTPSYVTKMERGHLKKIDTESFLSICNRISDSTNGVFGFLDKAREIMRSMKKTEPFSPETRLSLLNINDCTAPAIVSSRLRQYINEYIELHEISIDSLVEMINRNEDIRMEPGFHILSENEWSLLTTYKNGDKYEMLAYKACFSTEYINGILDGSIETTHRAILCILIQNAARITNSDHLYSSVETILDSFDIPAFSFIYGDTNTGENLNDVTGFDTVTRFLVQDIISSFKTIFEKYPDHGIPGLTKLSVNLQNDLGFTYAFLNTDLNPLKDKTKEQKQQFLNEVRDLVKKYAEQEPEVELFF